VPTALAASRGPFQESVFGENDREIPFPSLNDVRRVVRRAYLAGGLGLDNTGGLEPVPPPTEPTPVRPLAWSQVQDESVDLHSVEQRSQLAGDMLSVFASDRKALVQLSDLIGTLGWATGSWQRDHSDRRNWDDWVCWAQLVRNLSGATYRWHNTKRDSFDDFPIDRVAAMFSAPPWRRLGLLFRLPSLGARHPSFAPIPSLGDQVLLSLASRTYFESRVTFDEFLPLILGAVILVAAANPTFLPSPEIDTRIVRPALDWLTGALLYASEPGRAAIEKMTEKLATDIAWLKLGPTNRLATPGGTDLRPRSPSGPSFEAQPQLPQPAKPIRSTFR
jgi:hypothetical protein